MEKYYHVSMAVAPKRARLQEAQDRLQATLKALEAAKAKLYAVEENIRELEAKYADSVAKKSDLAAKVKDRLPALLYGKLIVRNRCTSANRSWSALRNWLVASAMKKPGGKSHQRSWMRN